MRYMLSIIAACCALLIAFLVIVAVVTNMSGFHTLLSQVDGAAQEVLHGLWIGGIILFTTSLALGIAYAAIRFKQMTHMHIVRPGKHGPVQAFVYDGQTHYLTSPDMGQLEHMAKLYHGLHQAKGTVVTTIESAPQKQIESPQEGIPAIVRYEDVADEVPEDMSLLGIHPSNGNLELTSWEKLKAVWLVGSSSTGKSNTIFGKALEAVNHGARLLVVDQHIQKEDSLGKKLAPFSRAFLRPIAVTDKEVLATLAAFKVEFERRVDPANNASCEQKIVLICDEMNRMNRNEDLKKALQEIVAICGEESRGFGMYGWFLSQKCAGLKWLRDSAITVIVHRLTRFEEALLACNDDRAAAKKLLNFKVGRSYIYGVDFDEPMELQQPLYDMPFVESTVEAVRESTRPDSTDNEESINSTDGRHATPLTEPLDCAFPFDMEKFRQAQKLLLKKETQNKIICTVWDVEENTRAFRAAKEEFQLMLAYLASMARGE